MVWVLLGALSVPLTLVAPDLRDPVQSRVVLLLDTLYALHELRERLELGPHDPTRLSESR
jgi:hypothetical protein